MDVQWSPTSPGHVARYGAQIALAWSDDTIIMPLGMVRNQYSTVVDAVGGMVFGVESANRVSANHRDLPGKDGGKTSEHQLVAPLRSFHGCEVLGNSDTSECAR